MQRLRHSGSGSWLVESPEFKSWMGMNSSAAFCCYGIPGCGKSVLISSIIDGQLSRQADPQISATVAFYYCNYADKRTLDPLNLFGSIAQQLLRKLNDLPPAISARLETLFQDGKRPEVEDIVLLVQSSVEVLSSVVMFIDGLDEMSESERKLVFSHLHMKGLGPTTRLKIFVSSREDASYLMVSYGVPLFKVLMSTSTVSNDIEMYTKSEIRALKGKGDLAFGDPALENEIVTALVGGAKGMFLWVKFQLDDLCAAETDNAIRNVLKHLPRSLGETYDRLLGRIEGSERRQYVRRMFNWILCATRPLHVNELREAIAFTIDDRRWDVTKIPNDMARLIRACGNIVLIDDSTHDVQLAHYTVAQYLLGQDGFRSTRFHVELVDAEFQVGQTCVAYLSFSDFETQLTRYSNLVTPTVKLLEHATRTQALLPSNSSAGYAAKAIGKIRGHQQSPSGIDFARHVTIHHNSQSSKLLYEKFLLLPYVAKNWLRHTKGFVVEDESLPRKTQDQRHILLFDALALEKILLLDFRPWGDNREIGIYPFMKVVGWALFSNHVPLLQAVDRRATFHYYSEVRVHLEGATKSHLGSLRRYPPESLDSKLLSSEELPFQPLVHADEWGAWLYRCLTHGFRGGILNLATYLSFSGTDSLVYMMYSYLLVDAVRLKRISAVEVAVYILSGKPGGPRWFLSEFDGSQCNPLEISALNGSEDILHLLRKAGYVLSPSFVIHVRNNRKLFRAVETGDIGLVKCLVTALSSTWTSQTRKEINIDYTFPISRALYCLRMEQAQKDFITRESSANSGYNLDPAAEDCGIQEAIDLLLTGENLQLSEFDIRTLLWDAIKEDRTERLDRLLDVGADTSHMMGVSSQGIFDVELSESRVLESLPRYVGITAIPALIWAIINERYEITESLLLAGASLEDTDPDCGYTPLFYAVFTRSLPFVKLLNKYGSELKARDRFGRNVLEFANLCVGVSTKSVARYIVDQDKNYWIPIAKQVFDDDSWWA